MAESGTVAIMPGTFDPITKGHVDIIKRALSVFDKVLIAILINSKKSALFSVEERMEIISAEFKGYNNRVEVHGFTGLLVDFAKQHSARVIIRGLRAITDYEYETQMALMNKNLWPEIETFFLISRQDYSYISSSIVKQVAMLGGGVSQFVTPIVESALKRKFESVHNK